ncbi:hypothetical protein [Oceanimonas baumannii]|uniref:Uncharacterized protein n=1 Tax=Oceanimonas baumannii TaxID=129578 RepID=A0A235CGY4_9GAMM|nr:hypothetical protein [Oceanimonas baumannii]OYD23095.1 hypothetical protein B6S09_13620 [Oceanimonas baumannii]TDW58364.1 hypothetical protein LY04_02463 [Oceanimonas baumannii]
MSEHEALRKALRWLTEQPCINSSIITEAGRRFDLSPLDEQFLRDYFLNQQHEYITKSVQSDDLKSN